MNTSNNATNKTTTNSEDQCELIELISTAHSRSEETPETKAHVYVSPTVAYATVSMANNSQLGMSALTTILPSNYPLPRYVVAAGEMSSSNNFTSELDKLPDGTLIGTPILISANSNNGVVTGLIPDSSSTNMNSSVTYVKLAKPFVVNSEQMATSVGQPCSSQDDHPLAVGSVQNLNNINQSKNLGEMFLKKSFFYVSVDFVH
ncbi:unnamed protein product [Trichobilharzia regenti]|nr:unnamed protein product [Trichobilharzia regenti]